jgi:hypothetical protein
VATSIKIHFIRAKTNQKANRPPLHLLLANGSAQNFEVGTFEKLKTLVIKKQKLIKKTLSQTEIFPRKVKAMLNLRSAKISVTFLFRVIQ